MEAVVTKEMLKKRFFENGMGKYWSKIEPMIRHEIQIETTSVENEEEEMYMGQSKIGGRPDLPDEKF